MHRLTSVHGLRAADLRAHLGIGRAAPGSVPGLMPRLAAVTGYPPGNLAWALPELRKPGPDWLALRHLAQRACPRCTAGTRAARYGGCLPTMSTCAPATGTGPARPTPAATTRPFPWPRRSPNWPRRSARWTAHGGCTAGKPRSTPPSLPPASASSCGQDGAPPCPPEAEKPGSRGNGWVSGTHTRRRCPGESGSERLLAACPPQPIPPAAGRFDRLPVALRPLGHRHQQHVERAAEVSELIQRGRLDPPTVEVAGNEPVTFRSAKRLGQHLVRDAIQGIVEVLVTAASLK